MILEEYTLENTKIKFYDDYIVENIATQKECIDKIKILLCCICVSIITVTGCSSDSIVTTYETENYNMTEVLSKTEDIDVTEQVMEYSVMQTVYMASLQTSAKVIQPSLLDYIR